MSTTWALTRVEPEVMAAIARTAVKMDEVFVSGFPFLFHKLLQNYLSLFNALLIQVAGMLV
jgi:hypothetical protein